MRFDRIKKRLDALERKSSISDAVLTFADGSTRAVRLKCPLGIFCDACALQSWKAGPPEWRKEELANEPMPVSEYDTAIQLFARAVSVKSDDRFLQLVWQMCHDAVVREPGESAEAFLTRMGRINERPTERDALSPI
jgi:hypothetical protein